VEAKTGILVHEDKEQSMNSKMKIGFGFYRHMLNDENFRFARQAGATHAVVHLTDYTGQLKGAPLTDDQPIDGKSGWGQTSGDREIWSVSSLSSLKKSMAQHGIELYALENFDPAHWYDVLLAGPGRDEQIEWIQEIIRNMGQAGIPVMGYNFSLAGVAGRVHGPFARGGAESVGVSGVDDTPIPKGMVWNMAYESSVSGEVLPEISPQELWERLQYFLERVVPVAEKAGVIMAAHPDDPPAERVRRQPRLIYKDSLYYKLFGLVESSYSKAELCLGTVQEMQDSDVYRLTEDLVKQKKVAYIHFRNVVGKIPEYHEVFVDEGEIDMPRIIRILVENGYDGVIIPDHTPQMSCAAPWHAGMAYALGYMRGLCQVYG
jgi:mannonate dehydratase